MLLAEGRLVPRKTLPCHRVIQVPRYNESNNDDKCNDDGDGGGLMVMLLVTVMVMMMKVI